MRCLLIVALAAGVLGGCAPFVPYAVHVDAVVEEEPEMLAPFVRDAVAGTVIVGDAPAPPDAQYVARLQPHPAGTQLRIERRLTRPGFYDGTQLFYLFRKAVQAWNGQEGAPMLLKGARVLPQASASSCVTDSTEGIVAMNGEAEINAIREADEPPVLIGGLEGLQRQIEYPELARRNGTEGVVIAQFEVDEEGAVTCADVSVGLPFGINDEVLRKVRALRFEPGRVDGEPVKVRFTLPVVFRLR